MNQQTANKIVKEIFVEAEGNWTQSQCQAFVAQLLLNVNKSLHQLDEITGIVSIRDYTDAMKILRGEIK